MTNFKFSAKFKLFAIISAAIIVVGLLLGTILHFTAGGFYNYGGEYSNSKDLSVSYVYVDYGNRSEVEEIVESAIKKESISPYTTSYSKSQTGGTITYKFTTDTADEKLDGVVEEIRKAINEKYKDSLDIIQTTASWSVSESVMGGGLALWRGAVAIAVVVVVHMIYVFIRYKLTAAIAAFCADLHNFAIFATLLAICRIPVTSSTLVFGAIVILATAIGTTFILEKIKVNLKEDVSKKLTLADISDKSGAETFMINMLLPASLAAVAVIAFILYAITAASVLVVLSPILCALAAFAVCAYGTLFFVPAAYPVIGALVSKLKSKKPSKKGN